MMSILRNRVIEDLQLRNYSPRTIKTYVSCVAKFAQFFGKSPELLGPEQIRSYQIHLVKEKNVSWALLNQTVCALRFLYYQTLKKDWPVHHIPYAKKPSELPVVLSQREIARFFSQIKNLKYRTVLKTMYAAGLRLSEALNLLVTDIDSNRMVICIRQGKGKKDRYVPLSPTLLAHLREYWKRYKPQSHLFPGRRTTAPLAATSVQRICGVACKRAGISKRVTTHTMRHSFATHLLEAGTDLNTCGHQEVYYNSCRNRHCPKCQAAARAQWLEERAADLLDVQYFHLVFTLPETLSPIALQNKKVVYEILFRAVSETLRTISEDPKHLGAQIGYITILHTWGRAINHHPHLHCVIPGGGLSPDRKRWVSCRKDFFLPVRVLSRLFQKRFLLHVIPSGFMRIRHFGFLSNRARKKMLPLCRNLISLRKQSPQYREPAEAEKVPLSEVSLFPICPSCKHGRMLIIGQLDPAPRSNVLFLEEIYDTS